MSDNDYELERGIAQVLANYGSNNVVNFGELGITTAVQRWRAADQRTDVDLERIAEIVGSRLGRYRNRTTGDAWEDLDTNSIEVWKPRRITAELYPLVFYCEECYEVFDATSPQYLPSDGQCRRDDCEGQLTQLPFVNVCPCGRMTGPEPNSICDRDGHDSYYLRKGSGGPATWRFVCRDCDEDGEIGILGDSCGVCNDMSGPLPTSSSRVFYPEKAVVADVPKIGVDSEDVPHGEPWARVLMASHFGIPGFDDTPAEELAEQEGMVDEYEELVGEDEVDRDTLDLILERFDIEIGGSDTAMELTSEVLPPEARAAEAGDPEAEPSLAYEQVASELFTFLRSTRGYVGDEGNLDDTRHPIPHPLNEFLRKPEFRQQHGQSLRYWDQLESTHLSGAWVVDQFPLLNVLYGYTRADPQPGRTDLRTFPHPRDRGEVPIFVDRSPSEAIVLEVDRRAVVEWLLANDFVDESDVPALDDDAALREWFVSNVATTQLSNPFSEIGHGVTRATYWLLHSVSHCLLGTASQQCGLATGTLSERVLPTVPAIVVYAESTENFALGSMFTLFKTRLFPWLRDAREAGETCLLDPACRDDPEGAACDACIHVTETSCVALNHKLDRRFLTGDDQAGITGFWSDAIENNVVVPPQGYPSEDNAE